MSFTADSTSNDNNMPFELVDFILGENSNSNHSKENENNIGGKNGTNEYNEGSDVIKTRHGFHRDIDMVDDNGTQHNSLGGELPGNTNIPTNLFPIKNTTAVNHARRFLEQYNTNTII